MTYSGSTYIAIQANSNKQPDINPSQWSVLAQKAAASVIFSALGTLNFVTNSTAYLPGVGLVASLLSTEADGQMLAGVACTVNTLLVATDQTTNLTIQLRKNGATVGACSMTNSSSCSASSLGISVAATDLISYRVTGTTSLSTRLRVASNCQ